MDKGIKARGNGVKRYISLLGVLIGLVMFFANTHLGFAGQITISNTKVIKNCYVSYIDEEKLFIDGEKYILSPDLIITENQGYKIDKKTIAGVGFISKANVTIKKVRVGDKVVNEVVKIVILEMQQWGGEKWN